MSPRLLAALAASAALHGLLFLLPCRMEEPPRPEPVRVSLHIAARPAAPAAVAGPDILGPQTPPPPAPETPKPTPKPPEPKPEPRPTPPKPAPKPIPKPQPKPRPTPTQPSAPASPQPPTESAPPATGPATDAPSAAPPRATAPDGGTPQARPETGATGGIVDAARLRVVKKVAADYPAISRKRRDEGTVTLLIDIRAGRVADARVERSSGHPPLDESALRAVRGWTFDTAGFGDAVTARISFSFKLK